MCARAARGGGGGDARLGDPLSPLFFIADEVLSSGIGLEKERAYKGRERPPSPASPFCFPQMTNKQGEGKRKERCHFFHISLSQKTKILV